MAEDLKQTVDNNRAYTEPDGRSQEKVNSDPVQPAYSQENTPGEPSLPRVSRTSIGTSLDWINQQLTHECRTTTYIKKQMGNAQGMARQLALAVREGLKAFLKSIGIVPSAGGITSIIKSISRFIQRISYWIGQINNFLNNVVKAIAEIRAVIDYILSLPAKLIQLFRKCLDEAINEIQRGFFDTLKALSPGGLGSSELASAVKDLQSSAQTLQTATAQLAQQPGNIANAISNPSTLSDSEKEQLVSALFPGSERYNPTTFNATV